MKQDFIYVTSYLGLDETIFMSGSNSFLLTLEATQTSSSISRAIYIEDIHLVSYIKILLGGDYSLQTNLTGIL